MGVGASRKRGSEHLNLSKETFKGVDRYRIESRWTDVRGHRVHARIAATGPTRRPPIVLVHGLGVSSLYFGPIARTLAADFDVYLPDVPGFGEAEVRGSLSI